MPSPTIRLEPHDPRCHFHNFTFLLSELRHAIDICVLFISMCSFIYDASILSSVLFTVVVVLPQPSVLLFQSSHFCFAKFVGFERFVFCCNIVDCVLLLRCRALVVNLAIYIGEGFGLIFCFAAFRVRVPLCCAHAGHSSSSAMEFLRKAL